MKSSRRSYIFMMFAVAVAMIALFFWKDLPATTPPAASEGTLARALSKHEVKSAYIDNDGQTVTWTDTDGKRYTTITTTTDSAGNLFNTDHFYNYQVQPQDNNVWLTLILPNLFLILLFVGLIWFFFRQTQNAGNQAMSFGKSRARMITGDRPTVTFVDVAGVDEAKQELSEVVEFLKFPDKFTSVGARIPKGVLLIGPPGTGKTLLSKAVAGEAGVPFFSISGSEFVEMFVGVGASRVRDLFDQAKKNSPCIVFVDEIDAVGRQRGAGLGGGHDEREQTLNQLLVEMDGFETATHVIVVAATNRPDVLDPALLRPGRFDRHVILDSPDIKGRKQILDVHARHKPIDPSVELEVLARQTPGFSGADLANLINEAAILTARANKKIIGMLELEEAIARIVAGPERKSRRISDEEKRIIAYHEMGHALVMKSLENADPVHKISIISRGMALGWTLSLPESDRYLTRKSQLLDQMAGMLGGRCSEELLLGDANITTGAADDIKKASALARKMVTEWGMSEKLGPMTFGEKNEMVFLGRDLGEQRNYSEDRAAAIDEEVYSLVENAKKRAHEILAAKQDVLHVLAKRLVEIETMEVAEMDAIIADFAASKNGAKPNANADAKQDTQSEVSGDSKGADTAAPTPPAP